MTVKELLRLTPKTTKITLILSSGEREDDKNNIELDRDNDFLILVMSPYVIDDIVPYVYDDGVNPYNTDAGLAVYIKTEVKPVRAE